MKKLVLALCLVAALAAQTVSFGNANHNAFQLQGTPVSATAPSTAQILVAAGSPLTWTPAAQVLYSAGSITMAAGTGSHTFATAYGTAPNCVATDQTAANVVKATATTTAVTVSGTGTDVVAFWCAPAVN